MTIRVNLRLRASAAGALNQTLKPAKDKLDAAGYLIIEDVALSFGKKYINDQVDVFEEQVVNVILAELRKFANMMRKGIVGVPAKQDTPRGVLRVSEMGAGDGPGVDYDVSKSGVHWAPRSQKYLKRKGKTRKHPGGRGHTRWFEYDRELWDFLENPTALVASFGPIEVRFIPELKVIDAGGYTRQAAGTSAGGQFARKFSGYSNPTFAQKSGAPQSEVHVKTGRMVVRAFGNITADMLPALLSGDVDDFEGNSQALMGLLPDNIKLRLDHKPDGKVPYRMTIEPFVSWFLTRAIPYAVNRRLKQEVSTRAARKAAVRARNA